MQTLKIFILGSPGVGKTSLYLTHCQGAFPELGAGEIHHDYVEQATINGKTMSVNYVERVGGEDYDRLRPLGYPGTDVFMVLYSCVDRESFNQARDKWIPEIRFHTPNVPFIVVGTKIDLKEIEDAEQVSWTEGVVLADSSHATAFCEVSAASGEGMKKLFERCFEIALFPPSSYHKSRSCTLL